jgi:hypothetical protein
MSIEKKLLRIISCILAETTSFPNSSFAMRPRRTNRFFNYFNVGIYRLFIMYILPSLSCFAIS